MNAQLPKFVFLDLKNKYFRLLRAFGVRGIALANKKSMEYISNDSHGSGSVLVSFHCHFGKESSVIGWARFQRR